MNIELWEHLSIENTTQIVFLISDGLGGLWSEEHGGSELTVADTPNLDRLAQASSCGMLEPVGPGITPGSGPGHLALFGYDPVTGNVGRGLLTALGLDFPLESGDVAARVNFCSLGPDGIISDRRAGRIDDETNARLCGKITEKINVPECEIFLRTEREHRALLVLRADGLSSNVSETDPQRAGVKPLEPKPQKRDAEKTAGIVKQLLGEIREILSDEPRANFILLRGFDTYRRLPTLADRFNLKGLAIASYATYRGLARLVGMDIARPTKTLEEELAVLEESYDHYDFYFVHFKDTDSRGEDGNFEGKVRALERLDAALPRVLALKPDVFVITGDHSTPACMAAHSWHLVPVLLHSRFSRRNSVELFDEIHCIRGTLGIRPAMHLMGLVLAHAQRLKKFGA